VTSVWERYFNSGESLNLGPIIVIVRQVYNDGSWSMTSDLMQVDLEATDLAAAKVEALQLLLDQLVDATQVVRSALGK